MKASGVPKKLARHPCAARFRFEAAIHQAQCLSFAVADINLSVYAMAMADSKNTA